MKVRITKIRTLFQVGEKPIVFLIALLVFIVYSYVPERQSYGAVAREIVQPASKTIARLTRYEVKLEQLVPFSKAVSDYVLYSLKQEGNILSEAYYEQDHPSVLWIIERWSDKSFAEQAMNSASFKAMATRAKQALVQPAEIIQINDLEPLTKHQWNNKINSADQPITIMLFVDAKPGTEDTFKEVYHTAMPLFRSEPGVVTYQLSELKDDKTQFVTYEKFRNEEAFQYHLKFPPINPVLNYLETSIKKQPFQNGIHRLIELAPVARKY